MLCLCTILTIKADCSREMPQPVSRRHFTLYSCVRSEARKIFLVNKVALGQFIRRMTPFIAVSIIQSVLHIDISFIYRPSCIILTVNRVIKYNTCPCLSPKLVHLFSDDWVCSL